VSAYPVEPWELRAYVEEDPERTYEVGGTRCLVGSYLNTRLGDGRYVDWIVTRDRTHNHTQGQEHANPWWVREAVIRFDRLLVSLHTLENGYPHITGKQILEADILPRGDA
jgi:hypothetical protein